MKLARKIYEYDIYVRGITREEVRSKLEVLDSLSPLCELQEIQVETEPPTELVQSPLLLVLKKMFNVPACTSLRSVIDNSSGQIQRLRFSYVLRAILAYILHDKVFLVEEQGQFWKTWGECLYTCKLFYNSLRMEVLTKG